MAGRRERTALISPFAWLWTPAIIQLLAAINTFLSTSKVEDLDKFAVSSSFVCFISLLVGELGRKSSRASFLKFYVFGSSLASLISSATLMRSYYFLQVIKDLSSFNSSKFELIKVAAVIVGLAVQVFIISTTTSLIHNMALPKRTS